jgi:hypothetical protein
MSSARFPFEFAPGAEKILLLWAVRPSNSYVEVTDTELRARFGLFSVATPLSNIASAKVTGPYKFYRAIGPRLSVTDRGATFGSGVAGVCIRFHKPIRALFPFPLHPGLTVTVADREGLVAALDATIVR